MVAFRAVALRFAHRRSAVGLIQLFRGWVCVPQFWPRPVFQALVPCPGPGGIKRSLPGGEGGHASLPERPGLLCFMETGCSSKLRVSVAAPLAQLPSVIRVFEMSSSYQGLGGAHCSTGLGEWKIQPRVTAFSYEFGLTGCLVQKWRFDPKFVGRSLLLGFRTQGKHRGGTNNRVREGILRDVVHLGGLGQALLLHLFELLLCEAVAEYWRDYFLGVRLKALTSKGIVFLGKLKASPVGQRNVNGGIPSFSEAVPLLVALANVLLVRVFSEAGGMDGVPTHGCAALLSSTELPPQGDENSGKDDEQAQGDTCDGDYVVRFLVFSWLDRRWGGSFDSCKKEHSLSPELHLSTEFGILEWILQ